MRVDYSDASGDFVGDGEAVECVGLAPGAYQAAKDDPTAHELDLGLLSVEGVALPSDLWRCTFEASSGIPDASVFPIAVDDALDPDLTPIQLSASVTSIFCDQQATCGNGIVEGGEQCDTAGPSISCDANCKLTANTQRCAIGFRITGNAAIGGIQFRVDYSLAGGNFEGSGVAVSCTKAIESALTAATDRDADQELSLALVSATGIALPADLWQCEFLSNASAVQLENFHFKNVIATDQSLHDVPVSVVAVSNSCIYGPYCGDGHLDPGELCDDGNRIATDACTNACQPATCGDGIIHTGAEQCDDGNLTAGDCCSPSCTFEAATTVCRAAGGVCDQPENCTGASGTCPADSKSTMVCRPSGGICDIAEVCSGASNTCPADVKSTSVCRASIGNCDLTEACTGSTNTCPVDTFQPSGTACTSDGNPCTDDKCDGSGTCGHQNNSLPCNDGLYCNGTDTCLNGSCSNHSGNPCPGPDGDSDCSESCSESLDNCSANDTDGSACNDGNSTTSNDQCLSGLCVGGSAAVICGDADQNGSVSASDALKVLRAAVGQAVSCPLYVCDTDDNAAVQATDALRVLKKAVGQQTTLTCPAK